MRVLLIDDSMTFRRIEKEHLAALGITDVIDAFDGMDGLEKLEKNMPIELVLLDINMPKMDGITTLKRIRENGLYSQVRVIVVSSESEKNKILEALRAGASDYIVKPFSPEEFKTRMCA